MNPWETFNLALACESWHGGHLQLLALTVSIALGGCSGSSDLSAVTGKVTYKGQPVSGATILFMGDETTRPATAISSSDGSYSLMTLDKKGAAPGQYSVIVTKTEMPAESGEPPSMEEAAKRATRSPPAPKELLPAKYGDATRSPLKAEVKKGQPNRIELDLTD